MKIMSLRRYAYFLLYLLPKPIKSHTRAHWMDVGLKAVTLGEGKTDPRCVEYVWVNARDEKSILLQD